MKNRVLIISVLLTFMAAIAGGCSGGASRFEGRWERVDTLQDVVMNEVLTLEPGERFTQQVNFARVDTTDKRGALSGVMTVSGTWKYEKNYLRLDYDAATLRWEGDSVMGAAFGEEFAKRMKIAQSKEDATSFGLAEPRIRGGCLTGTQSARPVSYRQL